MKLLLCEMNDRKQKERVGSGTGHWSLGQNCMSDTLRLSGTHSYSWREHSRGLVSRKETRETRDGFSMSAYDQLLNDIRLSALQRKELSFRCRFGVVSCDVV